MVGREVVPNGRRGYVGGVSDRLGRGVGVSPGAKQFDSCGEDPVPRLGLLFGAPAEAVASRHPHLAASRQIYIDFSDDSTKYYHLALDEREVEAWDGELDSPAGSGRRMSIAIHWSGLVLVGGALLLGLTVLSVASRPVVAATISPEGASLLLGSAALLLLSLPAMYAVQADATGIIGFVAHILLSVGLLLFVLVAATPLLNPSANGPIGESPVVFGLGIALTVGLLLTGLVTYQADIFPRPAAVLILGAMAGFFFVFFVAEFLPSAAGQIGTATFGVLLALGFAWIGAALWLRSPGT
jgi:hypothetical protein